MVVGIVIVAVLAAVGIALALYVDGNRHGEERDLAKAMAAGFTEHQVVVDGATVNYAEGPDNGPAVLLVHGQGMQWEDYARALPDLASRYHVFAIDCFGHGESAHDPALYSLNAQGEALKAFAAQTIGDSYAVSGHSSGGLIAAWLAANDAEHVTACLLEDPPLFHVTPDEMQAPPGCFVWKDGFEVTHAFLNQDEVDDYAVYYAQHSYLFGLFGGLQPKIAEWTEAERAANPAGHVTLSWVPRDWVRGMYFFDTFDPLFSEAFYTGSFFEGVDQADILTRIKCPTIYLKAETNYGEDGLLYAANSDEDASRVQELVSDCETVLIKSGHDIHFEHPTDFAAALDRAMKLVPSTSSD
ncbi:predicted hydrolase or acyltransferase [Eggerthella sp. YY7918]|nr:predicted hydrolase or acyltransferase [Eggerthella sp. YY7918]